VPLLRGPVHFRDIVAAGVAIVYGLLGQTQGRRGHAPAAQPSGDEPHTVDQSRDQSTSLDTRIALALITEAQRQTNEAARSLGTVHAYGLALASLSAAAAGGLAAVAANRHFPHVWAVPTGILVVGSLIGLIPALPLKRFSASTGPSLTGLLKYEKRVREQARRCRAGLATVELTFMIQLLAQVKDARNRTWSARRLARWFIFAAIGVDAVAVFAVAVRFWGDIWI